MSSTKFHSLKLKDAIVWANVIRYLEARGLNNPGAQAFFMDVTPQQWNSWKNGQRGFGPKTIARFIEKTGLTEKELYSERENRTKPMRKIDGILQKNPAYNAAMILLEAGDVEAADSVMRNYLAKKYPLDMPGASSKKVVGE